MKCAIIRWWMEEYIDGSLPEKRTRWVAHHLQGCAACRQALAWRRSLREALQPGVVPASSQEMWVDFQRRLAQRSSPAPVRRVAWWQWGTASAAVVGALVVGVIWWSGYRPAPEQALQNAPSGSQPFALEQESMEPLVVGEAESLTAPPPSAPLRPSDGKPVRLASGAPKPVAPTPVRVAVRQEERLQERPTSPPQVLASLAYAEVRNERGELMGKVMLQTTYDKTGTPQAILIEADSPAVVEVQHDEQPMDSSHHRDDTHGSASSPTPTAGTRPGLPD